MRSFTLLVELVYPFERANTNTASDAIYTLYVLLRLVIIRFERKGRLQRVRGGRR